MLELLQSRPLHLLLSLAERRHRIENFLGWLAFLAYLAWFYRVPPWMWTTHLPLYYDVVEALWQIEFWRRAVLSGDFNPVSFAATWPIGTHMFSVAHNGVGMLFLVFSIPFGSIAAVNLGFLLSYVLSFVGFKLLLQRYTQSPFLASTGGILATFAFGKTLAKYGHLHISVATAFIVWAILFATLAISSSDKRSRTIYILLWGTFWGISAILQPYFAFFGALTTVIPLHCKRSIASALLATAIAATVSLPYLVQIREGQKYMSNVPPNLATITYKVDGVPTMHASLPSVVGWTFTAWHGLRTLTYQVLRRPTPYITESIAQNWGLLVWIFALLGVFSIVRKPSRHKIAVITLLVVSFLLAMGPLWVDPPLLHPLIVSANKVLWGLGEILKPSFFDLQSSWLADRALPLPSFPLYLLVPYFEMARIPARYLIFVGFSAVILGVLFLDEKPRGWRLALGALWLLELLPRPSDVVPAPIAPHPAHAWFAQNFGTSLGLLSPNGANWAYSSYLANANSTSVLGSFASEYMLSTSPWIKFPPPKRIDDATLSDPDLVNILIRAQVRFVLLTPEESQAAAHNPHLRLMQCFPAPGAQFSYLGNTTLCAFEVTKPPATVDINIQPRRGFSGFEKGLDKPDRLIWVTGKEAEAGWHLHSPDDHTLDVTLRAFCPPNTSQTAEIFVNAHRVARLHWSGDCWEPRNATIYLPRALLRQGWNTVVIKAASAARPIDHVEGNTDRRLLSIAAERLHLRPVQNR